MTLLPELPAHLHPIQSLLDDCTQVDLSLISDYIVERIKQQQVASHAEHMARFQAGDRASFLDKQGQQVEAVVIKPNKKTISLLCEDGKKWNVSPELLQKTENLDNSSALAQSSKPAPAAIRSIGQKREWVGGLVDAPVYISRRTGRSLSSSDVCLAK